LSSYEPNLKGMVTEQQGIDAQKRMVAASVKELPLTERILKPKNWPTVVKVVVSAGLGAGLAHFGLASGTVAAILSALFGG
jgi:hypothetical protein